MFSNFSTRKKAILALIIANVIWGAASPIFKYSLENIPPFTLAFLRFGIATLILLPFVHKELHSINNEIEHWKDILLYALFAVSINITFYFWALRLTESINAPIIASSGPILTFIFSVMFLGEKPKINKIIGMGISFLGILSIIFEPLLENGLASGILGNLFLIVATLSAVMQTIIGRKLTQKYPPLSLTFWSFAIGSLTFVPFMLSELFSLKPFDIRALVGITYGAVFSSTIAYSLFAWGLSKIEASETGIFAYIDPIAAIIIAYPLLGEKPTPLFILGTIFVFTGILISEKRIHYHPIHKLFQKALGDI
jgi:drug/metabolite transporter (DMT)-like permease